MFVRARGGATDKPMIFNSLDYFIFLAIALAGYFILARRAQNAWLLAASYIFYGWWDWRFLSLILISTVVDYCCGIAIHTVRRESRRRFFLLISLVVNLGILGFFKYFNFFIGSAAELLSSFGLQPNVSSLNIILPVGISFYTFQTLSYTIDIYRRKLEPIHEPLTFALFVSFFPQLVAGPIERARNLLPQLQAPRKVTMQDLSDGTFLILMGLFRKVVIADTAAPFVDRAFGSPEIFTSSGLLIATFLFAIQIYGDFAGYSDIARGTARLLGIRLMVNFTQPYFATNITDFWRRWHMSLSSWLRDYLYIPLGGNRHGTINTYKNLILTMLLGGLWHGAAWGFVLWGALHGAYLAMHKFLTRDEKEPPPNSIWSGLLKRIGIFVLVSLTWIPFRQPDIGQALTFFGSIINWHGSLFDVANPGKVLEPGLTLALSLIALLIVDTPMYRNNSQTAILQWPWLLRGSAFAAMIFGIMLFGGTNEVDFIYFQF